MYRNSSNYRENKDMAAIIDGWAHEMFLRRRNLTEMREQGFEKSQGRVFA